MSDSAARADCRSVAVEFDQRRSLTKSADTAQGQDRLTDIDAVKLRATLPGNEEVEGMRETRTWLIGILLLVLSSNPPSALEFRRHNADSPVLNAIAATGTIEADDSERLLRYLRTLPTKPNTAVYLGSPGGSLMGGLKLGYLFKEMRIKTVVEGDPPNNLCASACALAFLGGHDPQGRPWRSSTTSSLLGYHQFYCGDGKQCGDEQATVSVILRYGRDVGAPLEIFIEMFNHPPDGMHWFSTSELCSLNIKVWDTSAKRFQCQEHRELQNTSTCLQYDKPATLTGRLSSHKTDYQGDAKDFSYIKLTLDTLICVVGFGGLNDDDAEYNVRAMHVIDDCPDGRRTWTRGARVKISGELFHRHTIYHQTPVLISANQIKRLDGPTPACKGRQKTAD